MGDLPAFSEIVSAVAFSLGRILVSLLIAVAAAVPAAVFTGTKPFLCRLFSPLIMFLYSIPKIALFPLALLVFGLNDAARIMTAALVVFFQTLITVIDSIRGLPYEYRVSIDSAGAGRFQRFIFLYLPAALPSIFTSLRIGVGAAFAVLFFTEASITRGYGLGRLVIESWSRLDYRAMALAILLSAVSGLALFIIIDLAEKRLLKWKA